jgi:hypothetical protein
MMCDLCIYLADECIHWEMVQYSTKGGMYMDHLLNWMKAMILQYFPAMNTLSFRQSLQRNK